MSLVLLLASVGLAISPLAPLQDGSTPPPAAAVPSLEDGCRAVFEALRADDVTRLEAVFPAQDELAALLDAVIAGLPEATRTAARKQVAERGLERVRADGLATVRRRFAAARLEGAADFDWATAQFVAPLPLADPPLAFEAGGWVVRNVEFLVLAGGRLASFGARDVGRGPRGWVFLEGPSYRGAWRREGEAVGSDAQAEADLEQARAELRLAREALAARDAALEETEQRRLADQREAALAADAWRAEAAAITKQRDDTHRDMLAELDRVRAASDARAAELDERLYRATSERDELALRLTDLAEEVRLLAESRDAAHERLALHEKELVALRAPRPAPLPGRELPAWCGTVADAALRDALLAPFPVDVEGVSAEVARRLIADHRGVHTLLLPSANELLLSAPGFDLGPSLTVADALQRLVPLDHLALDQGLVVLGTKAERARFAARRASPSVRAALRVPEGVTFSTDALELTASDALRYLTAVSGVGHWAPSELEVELLEPALFFTCSRDLSPGELLDLLLGAHEIAASVHDGVIVLTRAPLAALPKLDPEVARRAAGARTDVELDRYQALEERLAGLAAALGMQVTASAEAADAWLEFATMSLREVELATVLALHELDLGGAFVWRVVDDALRLVPR